MPAKRKTMTMAEWLNGQCSNTTLRERYGAPREFRLVHLNSSKVPDGDIGSFPVPPDMTDTMIDSLAQSIHEAAESDAQTLKNAQTYAVISIFEVDGEQKQVSRYVMAVSGIVDTESAGFDTEPATERGLAAQAQRHVEGIWRIANQAQLQALSSMQAQMEKMTELVQRYAEREVELSKLVGELTMKKADAEMALRDQAFKIDLKREAGQKFMALLPTVVNRIAGIKLLDAGDNNPLAKLLLEWGGDITEEQFAKMMEPLDDTKKMQALMLFQEIMRYKEEQAKKQAQGGSETKTT